MRDVYAPGWMRGAEVDDPITFAVYARQVLGVPMPNLSQERILRKTIKTFFAEWPQADYQTLVHIVDWCRARKKRPTHSYTVISKFRDAYAAGALPELDEDPAELEVTRRIERALEAEQDPSWRRRLLGARGTGRKEVLHAWTQK